MRPVLSEQVGDLGRQQDAIGKERQEQALALGVPPDLGEIRPKQRLAAGDQQEQAACLHNLIQYASESAAVVNSRAAASALPAGWLM